MARKSKYVSVLNETDKSAAEFIAAFPTKTGTTQSITLSVIRKR